MQVCVDPIAKAGWILSGSLSFGCCIVLEEEWGLQARGGGKRERKEATGDVIIISKWKSNKYPLCAINLHKHSWFFKKKWAATILEWTVQL